MSPAAMATGSLDIGVAVGTDVLVAMGGIVVVVSVLVGGTGVVVGMGVKVAAAGLGGVGCLAMGVEIGVRAAVGGRVALAAVVRVDRLVTRRWSWQAGPPRENVAIGV